MTAKRIALITVATATLIVVTWAGLRIAANVGVDFAFPQVRLG